MVLLNKEGEMYAGLDFGTTLLKMVSGDETNANVEFNRNPFVDPEGHLNDRQMLDIAFDLHAAGVRRVAVTGSGAGAFVRMASKNKISVLDVVVPEGDPVAHEITTQADGIRRLLAAGHVDAEEFMLVSIGSGTSFARVSHNNVKQYEPGLAVGGRFISRIASLVGVETKDIDVYAKAGNDVDLLMKHAFPDMGFPKGEFVLASFGRLGDDGVPATKENVCAGVLKHVATATAGHLMSIKKNPEWDWKGPVVFIGTPVSECAVLREWLQLFSFGLGLKCYFPENGAFAGALGAYHLAAGADADTQFVKPASGVVRKTATLLAYHWRLFRLLLSKFLRRNRTKA